MSLGRTRGKVGWGQVTEALQCMFRASHVGSEVWGRTSLWFLSYTNITAQSICSFCMTEEKRSRELEVLQQKKVLKSPPLILGDDSDRGTWQKPQLSEWLIMACAWWALSRFSTTYPWPCPPLPPPPHTHHGHTITSLLEPLWHW